jgi:hypothetical protein
LLRPAGSIAQQSRRFQLLNRQPYNFVVHRRFQFVLQALRYPCDGSFSVALPPHHCGCFVQAMRFVPLQIVDQHFARQFFYDQSFFSRTR